MPISYIYYKFLKARKKIYFFLGILLVFFSFFTPMVIFACSHEVTETVVVTPATCIEQGQEDIVCVECGGILESHIIEAFGHSFNNYTITTEPSPNKNGVESSKCDNCNVISERDYICPHSKTFEKTILEPTCTKTGLKNILCEKCNTILEPVYIEAVGHTVEQYEITVKPTATTNGIQSGTCSTCRETVETEYICDHDNTHEVVAKEATCQSDGKVNIFCDFCEAIIGHYTTDPVNCAYGDWSYIKHATPFNDGERSRSCVYCHNTVSESYSMSMPSDNSIYIPGTGICHNFAIASFTQNAVDGNDLVYCYATAFDLGEYDPFVIGHNTGTMRLLKNTDVGQHIYLSKNGIIETYKVVISEFAMQNESWDDIIGQDSGISIFTNLGEKTLHMYTCYEGVRNGRWIILAKLIS